jgi:anti-sigma-K factor RskA
MSDAVTDPHQRKRSIAWLWLISAVAIAAILAANAHLVYVATTSQPACVAHLRTGDGSAERGLFSAAQSSCSPLKPRDPS